MASRCRFLLLLLLLRRFGFRFWLLPPPLLLLLLEEAEPEDVAEGGAGCRLEELAVAAEHSEHLVQRPSSSSSATIPARLPPRLVRQSLLVPARVTPGWPHPPNSGDSGDGGRPRGEAMALRDPESGRGRGRGTQHPAVPPSAARVPGRERATARHPAQPRRPFLLRLLPHRARGRGSRRRRRPLRRLQRLLLPRHQPPCSPSYCRVPIL